MAKKPTNPAGSYTVDPRQDTMPGLPSRAPVVLTEAEEDERRLALLSPEDRARAIAAKYRIRGKAAPAGQMGFFGEGFGGFATAANQLDLFRGKRR